MDPFEEELARDEADFEERWDNIHLEGILIPLPTIPGMTRSVLQYCQWQQATELKVHQKKMVRRCRRQAQQLDPAAQAELKREWTRQQRAETLALYQTHQLQLEALDEPVSKPVQVVPLAPDRDLAQVDVPVVHDRAIVVPLAPDRELAQNDGLNVRNVRPNPNRPTQVPQGSDLAQVVQHARQRLHRFHRRPRRHRRPPRLQRQRPSSRHAGYTCGPNSSDRQKRPKNIFVLSGKNRLNKRRRAPNSAV